MEHNQESSTALNTVDNSLNDADQGMQVHLLQQSPALIESLVVDTLEKQFMFQGQCLVLGDSGVGKTSLVKSLTGKSFNSSQPKTQGIEQSLVDQDWKNLAMKDLIFGELWDFFTSGLTLVCFGVLTGDFVEQLCIFHSPLLLFCLGGLITVILSHFVYMAMTIHPVIAIFLTYYQFLFCVAEIVLASAFYFSRNVRIILATFNFLFKSRGLVIGSFLALGVCYFDGRYFEFVSSRGFLFLATVTGTVFVAFFLLLGPRPFGYGTKHPWYWYLCQLATNHSQQTLKILCFSRLLLSILLGLIHGFFLASLLTFSIDFQHERITNSSTCHNAEKIVAIVVLPFLIISPLEFLKGLLIFERTVSFLKNGPWGPYNVLLIVLVFYHFKLALTSTIFYFVLFLPLFTAYTFYEEWFCINTVHLTRGNVQRSNKLITLDNRNVEMNKMLKHALNEKFAFLKVKILDFAGDKEYIAYHHLFLRSQAVNVIVFNMATFTENDFKEIYARVEGLQFWIESVCSHVPPKVPIFLVGTHRGTMGKKCIGILDEHLRTTLWNSYCDELVVNDADKLIFFPVENSLGKNDTGIHTLQKKIMSVAEQCKETIGRNIPLSWIKFQDAIIRLQEKKEAKFCVTTGELPAVFDNFVFPNGTQNILPYFHEKGLVIYLARKPDVNLSSWVLLKPEILVDIIIQLVTPPPEITQQRGLRWAWHLLQKKGMLTNSLLRNIISKVQENEEAIAAFLEEYDVICPLINKQVEMCNPHKKSEEQPTHFVPSLLPMSADGDVPVWHDDDTDKKFYIFFRRFLPEPLFHRLLSRAHKSSKVEFLNGQTVLYRDAGKFWMRSSLPYMLKLVREEKMVEVTFRCR